MSGDIELIIENQVQIIELQENMIEILENTNTSIWVITIVIVTILIYTFIKDWWK